MACDVHLMSVARQTGDAVLRCYAWSRPTVSFGRNERVAGRYAANAFTRAGVDAVRRPTGGRALLHHREVTYSVALPLPDDVKWPHAYAAINALLLDALITLGVDAHLVGTAGSEARSLPPDGPPCFAAPSAGEIAVGAAKLVGSAVWRERGAYLQHGSILLGDDQARLLELLDEDPAVDPSGTANGASARRIPRSAGHDAVPLPAATLHDVLGPDVTWERVADAVEHAAAARCEASRWTLGAADLAAVDERCSFFEDPLWLWRR